MKALRGLRNVADYQQCFIIKVRKWRIERGILSHLLSQLTQCLWRTIPEGGKKQRRRPVSFVQMPAIRVFIQ
jgi:hypothetical protein